MIGIAPKLFRIPGVESSNAPVANTVFVTGTATLHTRVFGTGDPGFTVTGILLKNDGTAFGGSGANYAIVGLWKTSSGGTITEVGTLNVPAALAANTTAYVDVDGSASGGPPTGMPVSTAKPGCEGCHFGPGDTLTVILSKAGTPVKSGGTAEIYLCVE